MKRETLISYLCLFLFAAMVGALGTAWCAPVYVEFQRDHESGALIP